jgi:hypothetical protein
MQGRRHPRPEHEWIHLVAVRLLRISSLYALEVRYAEQLSSQTEIYPGIFANYLIAFTKTVHTS